MQITLGIVNEMSETENRVAIVPEDAKKLMSKNFKVVVESKLGLGAGYQDSDYLSAGCEIVNERSTVLSRSDIIVMLSRPRSEDIGMIKKDAIVVGLFFPLRFQDLLLEAAKAGLCAFSLELLPRTTRAQSMDVLSSQAAVAGYRAAVVGAYNTPRLMPMLTTAAGTVKPANVLVIGAGVAGLMAVATAKRLGAAVIAYDVRRAAGDDVRSLGAKFLEVGINAEGAGGYARELTEEEKEKEKAILEEAIVASDLIITTAGVPGKKAPMVISAKTVNKMKHGSVIVDITAESGGNCELTQPGKIIIVNSVTIIGSVNPQSDVPVNASQMYSRNVTSFLSILIDSNGNIVDPEKDDLLKACMICKSSTVTFAPLQKEAEKK